MMRDAAPRIVSATCTWCGSALVDPVPRFTHWCHACGWANSPERRRTVCTLDGPPPVEPSPRLWRPRQHGVQAHLVPYALRSVHRNGRHLWPSRRRAKRARKQLGSQARRTQAERSWRREMVLDADP